ncbi:hypothetical protein B0T16DRAFT_314919 [Cercophora newfieldiana]|uniref:Uncharacterized protein n=1 Tax=Cercophora newfieldiana TaxID=92897 RepID=A0AA40D0Z8_9PEZI|nr:hypothetical protein B0T16DRAFT_314919 [Cercophora newfieldiana]
MDHCPSATSIVLDNAILTGVTIQPASSPSSCYSLPIPTSSLQVIALASNQVPGSTSDNPVFFYLSENATIPEYIATFIDGERCVLDVSSNASAAGRVALALAGESLIFDETGLHHFDADCTSASSIEINKFLDQITSIAETPTSPNNTTGSPILSMRKRDTEGDKFTVTLQVEKEIDGMLKEPQLSFGPSPCPLISRETNKEWGNFTFACQYPGANSSQQACEDSLRAWLQPSSPASSSSGNLELVPDNKKLVASLPQFLDHAGSSLAKLIPNITNSLEQGMSWIKTAKSAAIDVAQLGGSTMCKILHVGVLYEIVFTDPALPAPHTVGVYHSPPVDTLVGTLATHTTQATKEPPRQVVPGVDLTTVTATTFSLPLIGALTGLFGGLGGGAESFNQVATDGETDTMADDKGRTDGDAMGSLTPFATIFVPVDATGSPGQDRLVSEEGDRPSDKTTSMAAPPLTTAVSVVIKVSAFQRP